MMTEQRPIIVFDALCVLCSANAQFVVRQDRSRQFLLASMQSAIGRDLYRKFGVDPDRPETLIVVTGDRALRDSAAVLFIWSKLGWPWRVLAAARVLPSGLRDPIYRMIARNRYLLFGKRETCWVPRDEDRGRLL
jgi:predicted DCC family thiol-disulfide oxidoreductase YuxK